MKYLIYTASFIFGWYMQEYIITDKEDITMLFAVAGLLLSVLVIVQHFIIKHLIKDTKDDS